jgi:hypothetical protein
MASKHVGPPKKRRLPRKGWFFLLIRITGLLCKIGGWLLLGIAVIGFFFVLVEIGPTFVGSMRYLYQKMAQLTFMITLMYLLIFPILGLVGAVIAGIGFALGYAGTEKASSISIIGPEQGQVSPPEEPSTNGAG